MKIQAVKRTILFHIQYDFVLNYIHYESENS